MGSNYHERGQQVKPPRTSYHEVKDFRKMDFKLERVTFKRKRLKKRKVLMTIAILVLFLWLVVVAIKSLAPSVFTRPSNAVDESISSSDVLYGPDSSHTQTSQSTKSLVEQKQRLLSLRMHNVLRGTGEDKVFITDLAPVSSHPFSENDDKARQSLINRWEKDFSHSPNSTNN
jgi:hypothetical protein